MTYSIYIVCIVVYCVMGWLWRHLIAKISHFSTAGWLIRSRPVCMCACDDRLQPVWLILIFVRETDLIAKISLCSTGWQWWHLIAKISHFASVHACMWWFLSRILDKKMDFSTEGWLIGGRPNGSLIRGDHLFLNYHFFLGSGGWLIRGGLLILTWHYSEWYQEI